MGALSASSAWEVSLEWRCFISVMAFVILFWRLSDSSVAASFSSPSFSFCWVRDCGIVGKEGMSEIHHPCSTV